MKRLVISIILILGIINCEYAQELNKFDIIEPTAASLSKYSEYPVDYSSGLPSITIPLYTIKSGDLSVDLTLSYHGGGIAVDENASWVGLGWDLFFGGMISRTVNGLPDENEDLNYMTEAEIDEILNLYENNDNQVNTTLDYISGGNSGETFIPDIYNINIGNANFTFMKDNEAGLITFPYIPFNFDHSVGGYELTNLDGNRYVFLNNDVTYLSSQHNYSDYKSTWYIKKIISSNNIDNIIYEYQDDGYMTNKNYSWTEGFYYTSGEGEFDPELDISTFDAIGLSNSISINEIKTIKPEYIYFKGGRVIFVLSERNDIYSTSGHEKIKKLDNIEIQKEVSEGVYEFVKRIKFNYSYFTSEESISEDPNTLKLKLVSVVEEPSDKLIASFEYYYEDDEDYSMPEKGSFNRDCWGYPNGKNNSSPIKRTFLDFQCGNTLGWYEIGSADQTPNEDFMKIASLKSITYPTTGRTEFDWEMNRYNEEEPIVYFDDYQDLYISTKNISPEECDHSEVHLIGDCGYVFGTFNIYFDQTVKIEYMMNTTGLEDDHLKKDKIFIRITNNYNDGVAFEKQNYYTDDYVEEIFNLVPGEYTISISRNCYTMNASCGIFYNAYNPYEDKNNYPIGGLRIKSIKNFDTENHIASEKRFEYLLGSNTSSGILVRNKNDYSFISRSHNIEAKLYNTETGWFCGELSTHTTLVHSNPSFGVCNNLVVYQNVKEYNYSDDEQNGFINYEYEVFKDEIVGENLPIVSSSWKRNLKKEIAYNSDIYPVIEKEYFYTTDNRISKNTTGFVLNKPVNYQSICPANSISIFDIYFPEYFTYTASWRYMNKSIEKKYSETNPSEFIETTTEYIYNNPEHAQVSETKVYNNIDDYSIVTKYKYPLDYSDNVVDAIFISYMKHASIISTPLEIQTWKKDASSELLVSAYLNSFRINSSTDVFKPSKLFQVEINNPIDREFFEEPTFNGTYTSFIPNDYYKEIGSYFYNSSARLIEVAPVDKISTSYIWNTANTNPIASVVNAENNEIFHDNFEDLILNTEFWNENLSTTSSESVTGERSIFLSEIIEKKFSTEDLNSGEKYVASVWIKTNDLSSRLIVETSSGVINVYPTKTGEWELLEVEFEVGQKEVYLILDGKGAYFDDVRLYPADAQMTTYTYDYANNVTSISDPNNVITKYEYDTFERLIKVYDQNGNLINSYEYNYATESE